MKPLMQLLIRLLMQLRTAMKTSYIQISSRVKCPGSCKSLQRTYQQRLSPATSTQQYQQTTDLTRREFPRATHTALPRLVRPDRMTGCGNIGNVKRPIINDMV